MDIMSMHYLIKLLEMLGNEKSSIFDWYQLEDGKGIGVEISTPDGIKKIAFYIK